MIRKIFVFIILFAVSLNAQEEEKQEAVISIKPQEWNIGKVSAEQLLSNKLTIKNEGNAKLIISVIRPSSDDISFTLDNPQITPKSSSELQISFRTPSKKGAFKKFIIIESNDKSKPILKVEIKGEVIEEKPTEKEPIFLFYSEENEEIRNVIASLSKLEKSQGVPFKALLIDNEENYKLLRELENKHKLTRGAPVEMFYSNRYFLGLNQIVFAVSSLSEGKSIDEVVSMMTGITFDHKHIAKTKTPITQGTAIYQPLVLDVFFESVCNECQKIVQKYSDKFANKFKKRLRIRFPDMKNQESRALLMNILDVDKFPEHSSFVVVVGGRYYIGSEEVFDEVEKLLDKAFAGTSSSSQVLKSESYTSEIVGLDGSTSGTSPETPQTVQKTSDKSVNNTIIFLTGLSSFLSLLTLILLFVIMYSVLKKRN